MLQFPNKLLRAQVIVDYMRRAGYRGCVCFSCGNASAALRQVANQGPEVAITSDTQPPPYNGRLQVVDVSPIGGLVPTRWWTPAEIRQAWPDLFDATSGHLPAWLMLQVGARYRQHLALETWRDPILVPTGSGETITCLRWAYPGRVFVPCDDGTPATARDMRAPLLALALQGGVPCP